MLSFDRILNISIIDECCRRCCKMYVLCLHTKGKHYTAKQHGQFCCPCPSVSVGFIDSYPAQALLLGVYQMLVTLAKKNVFKHRRIGEQDVWCSILASDILTRIDHSRVLVLVLLFICGRIAILVKRTSLVVCYQSTNHLYLPTNAVCIV